MSGRDFAAATKFTRKCHTTWVAFRRLQAQMHFNVSQETQGHDGLNMFVSKLRNSDSRSKRELLSSALVATPPPHPPHRPQTLILHHLNYLGPYRRLACAEC